MNFSRRSGAFAITAGLAALALGLTGCGASGAPAATGGETKSSVAGNPKSTEQSSMSFALYRQATAAPIFATGTNPGFGVTVKPNWVESSAAGMALLLGGNADLTYSSFWGVVDAVKQDLGVVVVSEMFRFGPGVMTLETLPGSGINSLKDLAGKTVAVPALNSAQHNRLEYAFLKEGLDSSKVKIVELPFGEVTSALANGTIDAGSVAGPPLTNLKAKYKTNTVLDFAGGIFENAAEGAIVTTRKYAEKNPNAIAAFQCTWAQGVAAVDKDDALFKQILQDKLGFSPEVAAAEVPKKPRYQTSTDAAKIQEFPDIMVEIGNLDKTIDLSSFILPQPASC